MEILRIRKIFINEVSCWLGVCGNPSYFPPEKSFVAETGENVSFFTTIGGTEIYSVDGEIPAGAYEDKLKSVHESSCAIPITSEKQFRECVELIIEKNY